MDDTKFIIGMRDAFFNSLFEIARKDRNVIIITADNGAPSLDQFYEKLPGQYINVGIAEQQMIGMACGMAFEGKKVYTYAIAPFVTARVFEQNKLDVCAMNLPIVNLGVGAGYAYDIMGPSHHTVEDIAIMRTLPNLKIHSPADSITAAALAGITHRDRAPQYVRFDRSGIPNLYEGRKESFEDGLIEIRAGGDVCLISTGVMVHQALKVSDALKAVGIRAGVVDLHRIKPVNEEKLLGILERGRCAVTLEEHRLAGGLGSIVAELFADRGVSKSLLRIGQGDVFVFELGGRAEIWKKYGLDAESVTNRIRTWMDSPKRASV